MAVALRRLCRLYVIHTLLRHSVYYIEVELYFTSHIHIFDSQDGYIDERQLNLLREHRTHLLAEIRPDCVALVDAWDFR